MEKQVIKDQELFFDMYAESAHRQHKKDIFFYYANQQSINCFSWIENEINILDFGCGQGATLDLFFLNRSRKDYNIYGVDISASSIRIISEKYPEYKFYKISDNTIPQIKDNQLDGACLNFVLHHAEAHESILREIYLKLRPSGKFYLIDLSSNNPVLKFSLFLFRFMPSFIKNKFSDDYVINGKIPQKIKVDIETTVVLLEKIGFEVTEIGYGHLFFILFGWMDRFVPLSRIGFMRTVYKKLIAFEQYLLQFKPFQKRAEVFYIKCRKRPI